MIITGIKAKKWDRYAHETVFGAMSSLRQVRAILSGKQQAPAHIEALLGFKWQTNAAMQEYALRVAFLYSKWQKTLDRMIDDPALDKAHLKTLHDMKRCTPDGVFTDITPTFYCRLYRPCPWCRYRKALEILERLGKQLNKTKRIAVTKYCDLYDDFDPDAATHKRVLEATYKERNAWVGDYKITLPAWLQDQDYVNQASGIYTQVFETSIIAFVDKSTPLVLPENAVTAKARNKLNMDFATPGGWLIWESNTQQALADAVKYIMSYPLYLVSKEVNARDFIQLLTTGNLLRSGGHGILR
jgi:hypothetical protein